MAIRPHVAGDLTYVRASQNTVRGLVAVDWRSDSSTLTIVVTVPANTAAEVSIPTMPGQDVAVTESRVPVWDGSQFVSGAAGISSGWRTAESIAFDVGSGRYVFKSSVMASSDLQP